jgi:hypothetical protein
MEKIKKIIPALILCLCLFWFPEAGAGAVEEGMEDEVSWLLKYYAEEFVPESLELIVAEPPDATGRIRDLYMDVKGCNIGGVRIDSLTFRLLDAQFNEPQNWISGDIECLDALQVYAEAVIREEDINADLWDRTIGDGDANWKKLELHISPTGLYGRGEYSFSLIFRFNILIEIFSKLAIVNGEEVWLEGTELRLNRLDVPDYVTRKALAEIQPLISLKELPIPLKLHAIIFDDKEAQLRTRVLPERIQGKEYRYLR